MWSSASAQDRALLGCNVHQAGPTSEIRNFVANDELRLTLHQGEAWDVPVPFGDATHESIAPPAPVAVSAAVATAVFADAAVWTARLDEQQRGVCVEYTAAAGVAVGVSPTGATTLVRPGPAVHALLPDEISRTITIQGVVAVTLRDGRRQLLLPDGNVALYYADGSVVVTNNRGLRRMIKADGTISSLPSLAVAQQIDPDTRARVLTRADMTVVVVYPDGSTLAQFADGTRIYRDATDERGFQAPLPNTPEARKLQPWNGPLPALTGPQGYRQLRIEAPSLPPVRLRAPDADADITPSPGPTKMWTATVSLSDGASLRWAASKAVLLTRACGCEVLSLPSGHVIYAPHRNVASSPLPELLTVAAALPDRADRLPVGAYIMDLGLGRVKQAVSVAVAVP